MGVAFVQRLAREPLLHFALIGALLFLAYEATRPVGPDRDRVVDIDRHALNRLATQWQAQWRRPPTRAELERLVAARVQEEVLYREAVAPGLDRGDPVVRRRLRQKLSIAWADLAALELPEEAELTAYYEAHLDRYRDPAELTLSHRFFSLDKRGAATEADAGDALARLRRGESVEDDAFHGAKLLTLPDPQRLVGDFGTTFRDAVMAAAEAAADAGADGWFGPVRSAYGWHPVRIHTYSTPRQRPLEEVRERVHLDWQRGHIERDRERRLEEIRNAYEVRIASFKDVELAEAPAAATGTDRADERTRP